tara:strand:+ start:34796 stop:36460 length:1665 start_codon:yes stop_codon:yes gene_type:complete
MGKSKIYFLLGFIALLILGISFVENEETSDRFEIGKNLDIFTEVYKEVNSRYVDGTQPGDLMKTGIDAMLESLDPYTVYYPESDIESYKLMTTGQYGGIGARIRKINDFVVIGEPYEGFPAYKAGLKAGDIILKVDGKDVKGKSTSDLSKILKGNPGTSLTVTIKRPGKKDIFDISFKRDKVQIKSVPYSGMLTDEIGYIKMSSFTRNVTKDVKEAFLNLKKNKGFKSLVFDLRGNPGGLLFEAINTVGLFTKRGIKVVETRGKIKEWTKVYETLNTPIDKNIPIVVLIDGGSASASEIVSGSLQDFDRAVVLGRNSYGKGLVQTTRKLKYNTSMKVTTAKYYIPSGRCIQAIDYSRKDKNGKVSKTPDSLLTEFKTKNGRIVLDGAGIKPDIQVEREGYAPITKALAANHMIFQFATNYVLEHDTIVSAKDFRITEEDYNRFLNFVDTTEYEYNTGSGKLLSKFEKKAEKDGVLNEINDELQKIKEKLQAQKKIKLQEYKAELKKLIEMEISTRYYYQKGRIQNRLSGDVDIDKAISILVDQKQYQSILSGSN